MDKKLKISITIVISVLLMVLVFPYARLIVQYYSGTIKLSERDSEYYSKIKSNTTIFNSQIDLKDIFSDFEWDRAYIQTDTYSDYDSAFGFETGVDKIEIWVGDPWRIIFADDDTQTVTYVYYFDSRYLTFEPDDTIVSKDEAVFKINRQLVGVELELIDE